jgi:glycosyltransferase involved in cell wall biosynthesis
MNIKEHKIFVVIPAFNEEAVIRDVIHGIKRKGYDNIIVVDDGSNDNTYESVKEIEGISTLRHKINRGKGAATKTGIETAKMLKADIIVTMDGDGQHDPNDINKLINPIIYNNIDVVLGTRMANPKGMPIKKRIANYLGNLFTWCLYGLRVSDSQSGFRAYSKSAVNMINTKADQYEYDSEIISEINIHKLKYKEIPIKVRYSEYSMNKADKQGFINGIKTLYKMIWNLIS